MVGTRPNFVKTAPVISALRERLPAGRHAIVHTGQHYDRLMSEVFLEELGVPAPDYMLEVGSGSDADLLSTLASLLPADDRWQHAHGTRGHGRSHVMPALIPPYATFPVLGGQLTLGTWQSITLVDVNVDNPDRQVRLSFLPG